MKKRNLIMWLTYLAITMSGTPAMALNMEGLLEAGLGLFKAVTVSDEEMHALSAVSIRKSDTENQIVDKNSPYTDRLAKMTKNLKIDKGLRVNIRIYHAPGIVNAFALPDGSIRMYSGTFDAMTDNEVLYIVGHEIGHVALGHSKSARRAVYTTSALRKAAEASGNNIAAAISTHNLTDIVEQLTHCQYSQANEIEADNYAVKILKDNDIDPKHSVIALRKLEALYGNQGSVFASHPTPGTRAESLEKELGIKVGEIMQKGMIAIH